MSIPFFEMALYNDFCFSIFQLLLLSFCFVPASIFMSFLIFLLLLFIEGRAVKWIIIKCRKTDNFKSSSSYILIPYLHESYCWCIVLTLTEPIMFIILLILQFIYFYFYQNSDNFYEQMKYIILVASTDTKPR